MRLALQAHDCVVQLVAVEIGGVERQQVVDRCGERLEPACPHPGTLSCTRTEINL